MAQSTSAGEKPAPDVGTAGTKTEGVEGTQAASGKTAVPPVTQSPDELLLLPVHDLLDMLSSRNISHAGLAEKPELVDLIVAEASQVIYV